MSAGQRVSNWVATGSHTTCPNGHQEVQVAYFVYAHSGPGWEYLCPVCGAHGPAEHK